MICTVVIILALERRKASKKKDAYRARHKEQSGLQGYRECA